MGIFRGVGGFKLGLYKSKEGEPKIISLWEPQDPKRQLANAFIIEELLIMDSEDLEALTRESLEEKLSDFKKRNPLQEDEDYGYLDLYLVYIEAYTRQIEERGAIIAAGSEIPEQDVPMSKVVDIFYRLFENDETFWS